MDWKRIYRKGAKVAKERGGRGDFEWEKRLTFDDC